MREPNIRHPLRKNELIHSADIRTSDRKLLFDEIIMFIQFAWFISVSSFMWDGTMFIVSTINILVKNWIKLAGWLKKTIGERGKFKKKLECYKAK